MYIMKIFTVNTKDFCSWSKTTVTVLVFVQITFNYNLLKNTKPRQREITYANNDEQPALTYSRYIWQEKIPRNQKPNYLFFT